MPEIAEVARVTHFLRQHLVGKKISKVVAQDDNLIFGKVGTSGPAFEKALTGKRVVSAGSQGKYFWLELDQSPHPVMHLGMTGWIHIRGEQTAYTRYAEKTKNANKEAWPPSYWKFHLETDSDPKVSVAFTDARRLGRVRLVDCPGAEIRSHSPLVENGPDPVVDREIFTEGYLKQKMKKRHVPIKALLLDQAMISGIGNWVGDEILYQAALHPEQYSDDFSDAEIARLYKAICYVCDTAVEKLGDSDQFPKDWLFAHRWGKGKKGAAKTLPTGEKMIHITVGGRTSCVVPSRQQKTGRVAGGFKEEPKPETETETETKTKEEKKSRFFDGGNDVDGDPEAESEARPKKKPRTATQKAVKKQTAAKKEDDESPLTNAPDPEPKRADRKTKETPTAPPLDAGRRRSTRLSKTAS